jgi:hypothetical protein
MTALLWATAGSSGAEQVATINTLARTVLPGAARGDPGPRWRQILNPYLPEFTGEAVRFETDGNETLRDIVIGRVAMREGTMTFSVGLGHDTIAVIVAW